MLRRLAYEGWLERNLPAICGMSLSLAKNIGDSEGIEHDTWEAVYFGHWIAFAAIKQLGLKEKEEKKLLEKLDVLKRIMVDFYEDYFVRIGIDEVPKSNVDSFKDQCISTLNQRLDDYHVANAMDHLREDSYWPSEQDPPDIVSKFVNNVFPKRKRKTKALLRRSIPIVQYLVTDPFQYMVALKKIELPN